MSTAGTADVVFCIDASASMTPCFAKMREGLGAFLTALTSGNQLSWDLRLDYLVHSAGNSGNHRQETVHLNGPDVLDGLYHRGSQRRFFTTDPEEFRRSLADVKVAGDEHALLNLDTALDFPWRDDADCHRVVIFLSDEAMETGVDVATQETKVEEVTRKIQELRVMLFLVAPESPGFDVLSAADRCEYEVVDDANTGLADVDFSRVLRTIGRSISVSEPGQFNREVKVTRGLFGQANMKPVRIRRLDGA